jgi:quinol monooxygenase YgiN
MESSALAETVTVGLLVRMVAAGGRETDVERFLTQARSLVDEEPATTAWFAIRLGPSSFGIFDVFPDEDGRDAHLSGHVAAALREKAPDLFAGEPTIEPVDVIAVKLPG